MGQDKQYLAQLIRMLSVLGLAVVLSACASRPKPLDPTRPYSVTEVHVTAQNIKDLGFAERLQQRLEATVGRGTSDIGQTSTLKIVVLDYGAETGLIGFFDSSVRAASLNLVIVDATSGQVLRSRALRTTSARHNGQRAETALVSRLVEDIRAMLGLSGTTPHPVMGIKRAVASPRSKPENLPEIELLSADPLLNGTFTPTTMDFDLEPDVSPTLDISKPLLSSAPAVGEPQPVAGISEKAAEDLGLAADEPAPVEAVAPSASGSGPEAPASVSDPAEDPLPIDSDAEPCVITLETECNDPDNQ